MINWWNTCILKPAARPAIFCAFKRKLHEWRQALILVWSSYVHLLCCATIPCSVTLVQAWDILANFVMIITNNKSILQAIIVEVISEKGERGTNVHNVHIVMMSQLQNDKIGLMSKWLWEVPTSQYYMYYSVFSRYSPVMNTLTTAHCLTLQNGKKII